MKFKKGDKVICTTNKSNEIGYVVDIKELLYGEEYVNIIYGIPIEVWGSHLEKVHYDKDINNE